MSTLPFDEQDEKCLMYAYGSIRGVPIGRRKALLPWLAKTYPHHTLSSWSGRVTKMRAELGHEGFEEQITQTMKSFSPSEYAEHLRTRWEERQVAEMEVLQELEEMQEQRGTGSISKRQVRRRKEKEEVSQKAADKARRVVEEMLRDADEERDTNDNTINDTASTSALDTTSTSASDTASTSALVGQDSSVPSETEIASATSSTVVLSSPESSSSSESESDTTLKRKIQTIPQRAVKRRKLSQGDEQEHISDSLASDSPLSDPDSDSDSDSDTHGNPLLDLYPIKTVQVLQESITVRRIG